MTRMFHPPELERSRQRDRFDPIREGERYGLSRDQSLAIFERVSKGAIDGLGRSNEEQELERFRELAAYIAARGERLQPDPGRLKRAGEWPGAWAADELVPRAPGRQTLVATETRRWVNEEMAIVGGASTHKLPAEQVVTPSTPGLQEPGWKAPNPDLGVYRVSALKEVIERIGPNHRLRHELITATANPVRSIAGTALWGGPLPGISMTNGHALWQVAERHATTLYRRAVNSGAVDQHDPAVESALQQRGAGQPLPTELRREMERELGVSLAGVRVHTDVVAARAAHALSAEAFAIGEDIFFAEGMFVPDTRSGKKLLVHELTHVAQALRGDTRPTGDGLRLSQPGDPLEREADDVAARVDDTAARPTLAAQKSGVRRADTPVQRGATSEVLQRQPAQQQAKPEIKLRNWLTDTPLETNEQVAAFARLTIKSLQDDLSDVESAAVKTQATEWIATVKGALPYFDRHAGEKVDPSFIPLINQQYDELLQIRAAMRQDTLIRIKEALSREHDAAVKAAEEVEALQPALDDALRAAYRKGSSSTVKEAVSTVKGALSVGSNLRTLAAEITKEIMGLPIPSGTKVFVDHWTSQIGTPKITIINVGKYTEKLRTLGRGLSALNIALTIADRSKKATEAEQGMKDLSDALGIGTDLISVSGLPTPPHFSLSTTLYIKPALKVIAKQIGVLVEKLSGVNRTAVEVTGDLMYPNAEPGGQEMFDLMVKVMHAEDESGFPALPSGVKQYLFDHREKLSTGAESDVPTEGSLFWKHLDGPAGRRWLFDNRKRVWAMFYGSMQVPAGKR